MERSFPPYTSSVLVERGVVELFVIIFLMKFLRFLLRGGLGLVEWSASQRTRTKKTMKYKIAYQYVRAGVVEIEADSLEKAKDLSMELSVDNEEREFYLEDSFQIDETETEELNKVSHE